MTRHRRTGWLPPPPRAAGALLCILALGACSEGYPTEDVPLMEPAKMTQGQLLAALNALGRRPHLGKRWRYALAAGCELEFSARNGRTEHRRVPLEGAAISTRTVDGLTEILLVPRTGSHSQPMTLLETRRWPDAVRARSLLTQLELRCGQPAAQPA